MNLQKPGWLVFVLVLAVLAFLVIFAPVRLARSQPSADITKKFTYKLGKAIAAYAEARDAAGNSLKDALSKENKPVQNVRVVDDRTLEMEFVPLGDPEIKEYDRLAQKYLTGQYGSVTRVEEAQPEKQAKEQPAASLGRLEIYRPHPQVRLGLDLAGGSVIVLRCVAQTTFVFESPDEPFIKEEAPAAKPEGEASSEPQGKEGEEPEPTGEREKFTKWIVDQMASAGHKDADVVLTADALRLTVSVRTPKRADVESAQQVLTSLIQARNPKARLPSRDFAEVNNDVLSATQMVLERRVNGLGVEEAVVVKQPPDRVRVELPGVPDPQHALKMLKGIAHIQWVYVDKRKYKPNVEEGTRRVTFTDVRTNKEVPAKEVLADSPVVLEGRDLKPDSLRVRPGTAEGIVVDFETRDAKKREFGRWTGAHVGDYMAIVLDGEFISVPVIESRLPGGGMIKGNFSFDEAKDLMQALKAGALPVPIEVAENRSISPTLGSDTLHKSLLAGLWGLVAVAGFMLLYYRACGLLADLALTVYCLLVLALLVSFRAVLTLPGIAGFILSVGMAVDANVIIFERLKEELRANKTILSAMDAGFKRAWTAILDCNVATLITCSVLYSLGTGPVRGFAVTLGLGVLCSMFSAVTVTRIFMHWAARSDRLVHSPLFVRQ